MAFDLMGGFKGAMTGSTLGMPGMVAGGLLGAFAGGDDPEVQYYTPEMYANDMSPYKDMIDQQYKTGGDLMDRDSNLNRMMNEQTMGNAMDQMGTANTLSQRNMAQQGNGMSNNGLLQQMMLNNFQNYGMGGVAQADQNYLKNFGTGLQQQSGAMKHMGDYSAGLAELKAGNIGTENAYNFHQAKQSQTQLGGMLGAGFEQIADLRNTTWGEDADGNAVSTEHEGLDALLSWF